jgi:hypothetical protein
MNFAMALDHAIGIAFPAIWSNAIVGYCRRGEHERSKQYERRFHLVASVGMLPFTLHSI